MIKSIKVITGGQGGLGYTLFLNLIHLLLKGMPFGILFFVINELLKPVDMINIKGLIWALSVLVVITLINIFIAIQVHVRGFENSYDLTTDARLRLGDHLRKLSLGFFKKRDPGDISSLLLQDMAKVENIFSHFLTDAAASIILPTIMAVFLFIADWRITLVMIACTAFAVPALLGAHRFILFLGKEHVETRNQVASRLLEYLQGIKVLMAFNLTGKNFSRLDNTMKDFCKQSIKLEAAAGGPVTLFLLILEFGFMSAIVLGSYLMMVKEVTISVFLIFLVLGYKFFEPLINFGIFTSEMKYMSIAADRITDVLEVSPLEDSETSEIPTNYEIEFKNVEFGYTEIPVLNKMNAVFKENSVTALVGPSGSGKTTITSLIARFWDVGAGSIKIGGVDIKNIPYEKLNAMISMVFQDVYLFQDTIFNNIKVGNKDATREEVFEAAKKARCHDFIMAMEKGYETMAGEGGARLSGGEKQRISIARALLKDAPIVLLDEATASLDPENELLIQKAISEMVKEKTLIVIAHRLKTISNADQIIVLSDGNISESGRHEELLQNDSVYALLWKEQQKSGGWKFNKKDNKNKLLNYEKDGLKKETI